jgi:THO complex subunit 2
MYDHTLNIFTAFRPAFYMTFWQLSISDLSCPSQQYEEQNAIVKKLSSDEQQLLNDAERIGSRSKASIHRAKRDRYNAHAAALTMERMEQIKFKQFVSRRLNSEKTHWFAHSALMWLHDHNEHMLSMWFIDVYRPDKEGFGSVVY